MTAFPKDNLNIDAENAMTNFKAFDADAATVESDVLDAPTVMAGIITITDESCSAVKVSIPSITAGSLVFVSAQDAADVWRAHLLSITPGVGFAIAVGGVEGGRIAWQIIEPAKE